MKKVTGTLLVFLAVSLAAGCKRSKTEESSAAMVPAPSAPAATKSAESTGVAECDAYLAAVEKYMNCANVPQAARDAQAQGAKQMRTSWSAWGSMPEDARKAAQAAAKSSCTTALATLKQAASATGCPVE